jgi:hypothetical protein
LPNPNRCSSGLNQLISSRARKMTMIQRIMGTASQTGRV